MSGNKARPGAENAAHPEAPKQKKQRKPTKASKASQPKDDGASQSDLLVRLAMERYRLGRTSAGESFAVSVDGPLIARMLRGGRSSLRAQLADEFNERFGKVPNSSALADAMLVLQGQAERAQPEEVSLRLAHHKDGCVVDLGDPTGRVVCVGSSGWAVKERSPVLFRRTELTGVLPLPTQPGDLNALRQLLNLSEDSWQLVVGLLVCALIPGIPHPIIWIGGLQGTGKSTAASVLARVIDPGPAVLRSPPRDLEQWAVSASGSWVVVIDNLSRIPEWLSDGLCRAVTGEAVVRRRLYSNQQLSVIHFRRVIIVTSIDAGDLRGDLAERLVPIDLEDIPADKRREDAELQQAFERSHPAILSGLLDVVSRVLAILPNVQLVEKSRMADFHRVLAAVDQAMGFHSLDVYLGQRDRIAGEVIDSDPIADAVARFAQKEDVWTGTASDLLERLTPERPPRDWPKKPRGFSGALRRVIPALRQTGVQVIPPSNERREATRSRRRIWEIRLLQVNQDSTVQTVQQSREEPDYENEADSELDGQSNQPPNHPANRPQDWGASGVEHPPQDGVDDSDGSITWTFGEGPAGEGLVASDEQEAVSEREAIQAEETLSDSEFHAALDSGPDDVPF